MCLLCWARLSFGPDVSVSVDREDHDDGVVLERFL